MSGIVIIGASHAGMSCAEKLRQFGYGGTIKMLERDAGAPLQRPPLSKTYLSKAFLAKPHSSKSHLATPHLASTDNDNDADDGDDGDAEFLLRRPAFFEQRQVDLQTGLAALAIDADAKRVSLSDGSHLDYDKLIIATGANPRRLPDVPPNIDGVHVLRTPSDARALRGALAQTKSAIVIGGGYIGLEAAASMRKHGLEVHVLEMAPRVLARVASRPISDYYQALHKQHGVHLHLGAAVKSYATDKGHIAGVHLQNGEVISCQLLLVGIGVIPDMALAASAGLHTGNGILVDANYRTNKPDIFAIGDVALPANRWEQRIESIHHAQFSGAVAASLITQTKAPAEEALWFWSDQYDVKLQIAGLVPSADALGLVHQTRAGRKDGALSVWSWLNGTLKSVESANDPKAYMVGKTCLERGISPLPEEVADMTRDLKELISK